MASIIKNDMTERNVQGSEEPQENLQATISQLSCVVHPASARGVYFIGWNRAGLPVVTADSNQLSEEAKKSVIENQKAGLPIREVPFRRIEAKAFSYVGKPIDYMDQGNIVVEDLLTYGLVDKDGKQSEETFGELTILQGLTEASVFWQDSGRSSLDDETRSAKRMYTLFIQPNDGSTDDAYAILFKPTLPGESNENDFRLFIRQTIGKLLVLDESQEPAHRKGYIEAAAAFTGYTKGNPVGLLHLFYNFSDDELDKIAKAKQGISTGLLKVARGLGLYNISDDELSLMKDQRPYYDVDTLDLNKLFSLVIAMRDTAYRHIRQTRR